MNADEDAAFEKNGPRLREIAHHLLGTRAEADEAVAAAERTWRGRRRDTERGASGGPDAGPAGPSSPSDPTAAVARACLTELRSREKHRTHPWDPWDPRDPGDPEERTLLTALNRLTPTERVAYVLHDLFSVPYEEVAPVLERPPAVARRLASRARYRVREAEEMPQRDLPRQRKIVEAFLAAARDGDTAALRALLAPEVVLRTDAADGGITATGAHGPAPVAEAVAAPASTARPALVDGAAGLLADPGLVLGFTVLEGRITAIDLLSDEEHLSHLDVRLTPPEGARRER
ncbi:sigma factor-like helix-turn-helix DNA-binding protein [Streptomyces sp. NPDC001728]|uniref:sigma factor-like helix-turn-helix DNA-binding protein n=1 Tax=Streptomyces sp. NPDC001728 TaxID=3154396 RepID=UPI00331B6570